MARDFDGDTDRIDYTRVWNPQGDPFSISFWVYRVGSNEYYYFFHVGQDNSNFGFVIGTPGSEGDGQLRLYRRGATACERTSVSATLGTNTWTHIVMTHDGTFTDYTTMHIYKDGTEVSYTSGANGVTEVSYTATNWSIGGRDYSDDRCLYGRLAEMAIWDRVLTTGEKDALAVGYSPLFFVNGMRGHWPLIRHQMDVFNGDAGTLDGTTVIEHVPTILYPAQHPIVPFQEIVGGERGTGRGVLRGVSRGI
ncbi:MAG: LamG domain-containing protein [Planctomycetota bacterium]|jgi:hypothetical protein